MAASSSKKIRLDKETDVDVLPNKNEHDPEKRKRELNLLFLLANEIAIKVGVGYHDVIDLDDSNLVAGILSSVFTYLRRRANLIEKGKNAALTELENDFREKTLTYKETVSNVHDFTMSLLETDSYEFDYIVATPLMNMITSFKLVLVETRLGTSKFTKGKTEDGKSIKVDIKKYGLNTTHLPWLTGLTFPPERRTGLMKCMGALTLGINLINNKEFQDKALNAFNESISHIDANGEIGLFLSKAKRTEISTVLSSLGDLLHLVGERSHRKMSFPLFALIRATADEPSLLLDGNFSSIGGYRTYALMTKYKYRIRTCTLSVDHIRQVIFHAMFGTVFEDLGVLSEITNVASWYQRTELDIAFKRNISKTQPAPSLDFTNLITFKKYSKLVSSNITSFGAGTLPQYVSRPTFAGYRNRNISKELLTYLKTGGQGSVFGATAHEIVAQLAARKKLIVEMIENKLSMGTVSWATGYAYNPTDKRWVWTGTSDEQIRESGVYVYGVNKKLAQA